MGKQPAIADDFTLAAQNPCYHGVNLPEQENLPRSTGRDP
jgi:hypothetical protein